MEYIYNEYGGAIGYSQDTGIFIQYISYKHGCVGEYHKQSRKYHRWKCAPGQEVFPMNNQDYGVQDVIYWDQH